MAVKTVVVVARCECQQQQREALRQVVAAQQNAAAYDAEERHGQEAAGRVEFGAATKSMTMLAAADSSGHDRRSAAV